MIFLSILLVFMFIFPNTLFFSMCLIIFSLLVVFEGVFQLVLTPLVSLLLITIYVGAVMILFGYICSVCPNPNLSSSYSFSLFFLSFFFFIFTPSLFPYFLNSTSTPIMFFYSNFGFLVLLFIFFLLLIILLIVTSHHNKVSGPFRSI